jgi:hypothetical protein
VHCYTLLAADLPSFSMVNFLRDVMIVVAVLATFIALAFSPTQETGTIAVKHDIPVGVPPVPVGITNVSVEAAAPKFDQHRQQ